MRAVYIKGSCGAIPFQPIGYSPVDCQLSTADSDEPSHVIRAMKPVTAASRQVIRFSMGPEATRGQIRSVVTGVKGVVEALNAAVS